MKNPYLTEVKSSQQSIGCIAGAMEVLSQKWTPLVIRELACEPRRFTELQRMITGINPRILTQRLDLLEEKGVIALTCNCTEQRPVYELTAKGRDLLPILSQMAKWGEKHHVCCD